jgi:hypothetical protein
VRTLVLSVDFVQQESVFGSAPSFRKNIWISCRGICFTGTLYSLAGILR